MVAAALNAQQMKTMLITNDYNVISFTIERRETKVLKTLSGALAAKRDVTSVFDNEYRPQNGTASRMRPKKRIAHEIIFMSDCNYSHKRMLLNA